MAPSPTALLSRAPANVFQRFAHREHVAVLAYHGVSDRDSFDRHVAALEDLGTIVSPDQFRAGVAGEALPDRPMLLTFDDGERSVLDNAAPVVAERGHEALLFVVGGLVDTDTPFWWHEAERLAPNGIDEVLRLKTVPDAERVARLQELRGDAHTAVEQKQLTTDDLLALVDAGFEIGNHTFTHPCLDRCDDATLEAELRRGHQALVERDLTPTAFAYPNGNLDTRTEPILQELGYDLGFLFDHHHADLNRSQLRISRLRLTATASPQRAHMVISGLQGAVMRLRGRG